MLDGLGDLRALSLRARALEELARYEELARVADRVAGVLLAQRITDPDQLTAGIEVLILRQRVFGGLDAQEGDAAAGYRAIMSLIAEVREGLDHFHWPVRLAEARLLYEKHNHHQAGQAVQEVLALNPGSAKAWALMGEMAVASFDLDRADRIADHLDELAGSVHGSPAAQVSTLGAIVRARAALRRRDPALASDVLDRVLERYPEHRQALALRAAASAASFDQHDTDRMLDRLDQLSPGIALGHYEVGRTLSEARQYERAASHLELAHQRLPGWADPVTELGLLEMQAGRDERARDALVRAVRMDPFDTRAANSLTLIEELLRYRTIETEHFVIRYREGIDEVLAAEMPPVLERIHDRVARDEDGAIAYEPDRRTIIELMPDHEWFSVRISGMRGLHTMAASTGPVIAMESPREGPRHQIGPYDWARVVQHEYAHTVTLARTRNRIPHWFTEAAAVYLEDAPRPTPWVTLLAEAYRKNELFSLDEISIAFVRPERPQDRSLAYAQGHWMYEFMIERWGPEAPLKLMDRYAQGIQESEALPDVLGMTPERFTEQFLEWAGEQLVAWGMVPAPGTPSLEDLLGEGRPGSAEPDTEPTWDLIQRVLEEHPSHSGVIELAARSAMRDANGTVDAHAAGYLERLAQASPVDPWPRRELVRYYLGSDDPSRAIDHLEWLDAREQHSPAFAAELARQYAALGRWSDAHSKAERTTVIAPFDADEREFAARVAIKAGRLHDARRHIRALTLIEPDRDIHRQRLEAIDRMLDAEPR